MLKISNLSKRFPDGPVLSGVSFILNGGEKVGLVGPNGTGKSTLLKIIASELRPDDGTVSLSAGDRVGYLPQYPEAALTQTVREALLAASAAVSDVQAAMDKWAAAMADPNLSPDEQQAAIDAYGEALARFEELGGYEIEHRAEAIRTGLGLDEIEPDRRVAALSGGQKTRLALARLLLAEPTILLLDEPTNYLDLPALLWLEQFVASSPHAAIIVSHDRRFLDRIVSEILELDPKTHGLRSYPGTFSDYAAAKQREREKQEAMYQDQVERIAAFERQIAATKDQAMSTERRTTNDFQRRLAKKVAKKAKSQEKRLERFVSDEERVERPEEAKTLYLKDLTAAALTDRRLAVAAHDLRVWLGDRLIIDGADLEVHGGDRLALVGANGTGKTTLLRALAGQLPVSGELRYGDGVRMGYLPQEQPFDAATSARTVLETFRSQVVGYEDEARAFLDKFLFTGDEVYRQVAQLSYGERAKLALAMLVASGANFLLLDEPTSHLDLPSLERIETALAGYAGPIVVVSHDRYFLQRIGVTALLLIEDGRLRWLPDLEHYEAEVSGERIMAGAASPHPADPAGILTRGMTGM